MWDFCYISKWYDGKWLSDPVYTYYNAHADLYITSYRYLYVQIKQVSLLPVTRPYPGGYNCYQ